MLVGQVIKFFPGVGSLVAAGLNGTVAATLTTTLGESYSAFLYDFIERTGKLPVLSEVVDHFTGKAGEVAT